MRCFVFFALLGLIFQPTCGQQYFVKLQPPAEGEVYQMQVGDIATFELATFKKTKESDVAIQVEIDQTFWDFNKQLLEKIYSDNYALQLKAVKIGAAHLKVTTFMGNTQDVKDLTILISE